MRRSSQRGVTLIEIMIVVTILSVFMLFAIPAMRGPHAKNKLRASARELVALTRHARSAAVLNGANATLEMELETGRYRLDLRKVNRVRRKMKRSTDKRKAELWQYLHEDIYFHSVYSWDEPDRRKKIARVVFYADGSASDSSIVMEDKYGRLITVFINRATAEAEIFEGSPEEMAEAQAGKGAAQWPGQIQEDF